MHFFCYFYIFKSKITGINHYAVFIINASVTSYSYKVYVTVYIKTRFFYNTYTKLSHISYYFLKLSIFKRWDRLFNQYLAFTVNNAASNISQVKVNS